MHGREHSRLTHKSQGRVRCRACVAEQAALVTSYARKVEGARQGNRYQVNLWRWPHSDWTA